VVIDGVGASLAIEAANAPVAHSLCERVCACVRDGCEQDNGARGIVLAPCQQLARCSSHHRIDEADGLVGRREEGDLTKDRDGRAWVTLPLTHQAMREGHGHSVGLGVTGSRRDIDRELLASRRGEDAPSRKRQADREVGALGRAPAMDARDGDVRRPLVDRARERVDLGDLGHVRGVERDLARHRREMRARRGSEQNEVQKRAKAPRGARYFPGADSVGMDTIESE